MPHRYTEAYEREWRQKEKAARERVAATNRDLAQARAAQQAARVAAQADMARLEAQEFHRIVEENRHIEQQQLQKVAVSSHLFAAYRHSLCSLPPNCTTSGLVLITTAASDVLTVSVIDSTICEAQGVNGQPLGHFTIQKKRSWPFVSVIDQSGVGVAGADWPTTVTVES